MPDIDETTIAVLGKPMSLHPGTPNCVKVLEYLYKDHLKGLIQSMKYPFTSMLDKGAEGEDLFFTWDLAFSDHLSNFMHLFGSTDPAEAAQYYKAYNAYFKQVLKATQDFIKNMDIYQNKETDDITQPVLHNMEIKLWWWYLGFHPACNAVILITTPMPLLTETTIPDFMAQWNSKGLSLSAVKDHNQCLYGNVVCKVFHCLAYVHAKSPPSPL